MWFPVRPGKLLLSNEIIGHLELVKACSQDAHVIERETKIKVRLCTVKKKTHEKLDIGFSQMGLECANRLGDRVSAGRLCGQGKNDFVYI